MPKPKRKEEEVDSDSEPDLPNVAAKKPKTDAANVRAAGASSLAVTPVDTSDLVDVEFDIKALNEKDFHGIKYLMQQLFWTDANMELSDWADLLLSQWECVGSVVKVVDSDDVLGIVSAVNLHVHKDKPCIRAFREYLTSKCPADKKKALSALFDDPKKKAGIVVSERLMNVPAMLAPPLHTALQDELASAVEDNEPFAFDTFLFVAKTNEYLDAGGEGGEPQPAGKGKGKAQKNTVEYANPEDEQFAEEATFGFKFGVEFSKEHPAKAVLGDQHVRMGRHVFAVPHNKMGKVLQRIQELYPGPWVRDEEY